MKRITLTLLAAISFFVAFAQMPNSDFEFWDLQPRPIDWDNNSWPQTLPSFEPYIVRQDTDAYTGTYSAQLYANGVFKAYAKSTFPVTYRPNHLSAWVKVMFPPCVNDNGFQEKDTVSIKVELLNNSTVVDQGYWETTASNFNWQQVIIPISQNATAYDSCRVTLLGGTVNMGGCGIVPATTTFNVDHLELKYGQGNDCIDSSLINPLVFCPAVVIPVCGCNGVTYNNDCEAYNWYGVSSWTNGPCGPPAGCIDSSQICDTCACNMIYAPVCGCDGVTYGNSCVAQNAGVTSWVQGQCGQACIDSSVVNLQVLCPAVIDPVCGCDGVTYDNSCIAYNYHGVTMWTQGPCNASVDSCHAMFNFGKAVDTVNFFNSSTGLATPNYQWSFGDGDNSILENPTHIYAQDGTYTVCLTISGTTNNNTTCTDTYCTTVYITHDCIDTSLICPPGSLCCDAPLFEPVCGCDSITYSNACFATLWNGVTHTTPGPCSFDAIKNLDNSFGLLLMPIPASEKLTANYYLSNQSTVQLTIVSLMGQTIRNLPPTQQNAGKHSVEIDISDLASGVYMLDIRNDKGAHSIRKFVKQ
jgi:PKD repeat protein